MDHLLRDGAITAGTMVAILLLLKANGKYGIRLPGAAGVVVFSLFMAFAFSMTGVSPLSGFHTDLRPEEISLTPFANIAAELKGGPLYAAANVGGNILIFTPLGFFLPLLWRQFRRLWKAVLFGATVSLAVECSQLFLIRGTDIDDLILNTAGAALGYGIFALLNKTAGGFCGRFPFGGRVKGWAGILPYACVIVPAAVIVCMGFLDRASFLRA
jgi:hypothetical protein